MANIPERIRIKAGSFSFVARFEIRAGAENLRQIPLHAAV